MYNKMYNIPNWRTDPSDNGCADPLNVIKCVSDLMKELQEEHDKDTAENHEIEWREIKDAEEYGDNDN